MGLLPLTNKPSAGTPDKLRGFSLVEMMFVIVIIGIITAITVNILKDRLSSGLLEKTASQMELILQAQSAYYTDQNQPAQNLSDLSAYLTMPSNTENPWGSPYVLGPPLGSTSGMLTLTTQTPSQQIAQELAGLLPGSTVIQNTSVMISVPVSLAGNIQATSSYDLYWPMSGTSGGRSGFSIDALSCPTGTHRYISTQMTGYQPNHASQGAIYYIQPSVAQESNTDFTSSSYMYPVLGFQAYYGPTSCAGDLNDPSTCTYFTINIYYTVDATGVGNDEKIATPNFDNLLTDSKAGDNTINKSGNAMFPGYIGGTGGAPTGDQKGKTLSFYNVQTFAISEYTGRIVFGTDLPNKGYFTTLDTGPSPCSDPYCPNENNFSGSSGKTSPQATGYIGTLIVHQWCTKPAALFPN